MPQPSSTAAEIEALTASAAARVRCTQGWSRRASEPSRPPIAPGEADGASFGYAAARHRLRGVWRDECHAFFDAWLARLSHGRPGACGPAELAFYCPVCAVKEFGSPRLPSPTGTRARRFRDAHKPSPSTFRVAVETALALPVADAEMVSAFNAVRDAGGFEASVVRGGTAEPTRVEFKSRLRTTATRSAWLGSCSRRSLS